MYATNGPWNSYKCKWCGKEFRGGGSSHTNLFSHRDGTKQDGKSGRPGCKQRDKAIVAGCVLPPMECKKQREQEQGVSTAQTSINMYVQRGGSCFSNLVLNQMFGLWAVQTSQPWLRIKDETLCACFWYANPAAQLFGRTWLALCSHKACLGMRSSVISDLKVSSLLFFTLHLI